MRRASTRISSNWESLIRRSVRPRRKWSARGTEASIHSREAQREKRGLRPLHRQNLDLNMYPYM